MSLIKVRFRTEHIIVPFRTIVNRFRAFLQKKAAVFRRSLKFSDLLLSLAEIGFKAFFRVENRLSYTYVFGCDFQQLVVVDKLYCLFKTQNTRSFESERVVAARSARVCEMLFLAYVYAYVLAFGRNPHHHALVNFRSGHNEQRAALLP